MRVARQCQPQAAMIHKLMSSVVPQLPTMRMKNANQDLTSVCYLSLKSWDAFMIRKITAEQRPLNKEVPTIHIGYGWTISGGREL